MLNAHPTVNLIFWRPYFAEERYLPGVGCVSQQDVIKREIVHQLCIMPMAHSELAKGLPVDVSNVSTFYTHLIILQKCRQGVGEIEIADCVSPSQTISQTQE